MNLNLQRKLSRSFTLKIFCLLGLLIVAGVVGAARDYHKSRQIIAQAEYGSRVMDKLYRIGVEQYAIRAISRGKTDDARQRLSLQLAHDLADLRSSMSAANRGT